MRRPSLDDEQARSARRRRPAPSRFADATVDKATRLGAEVPEGVVACPVVWRPWAGRLADWARNGDGQCRPRSHRQLAHGINSPVPATWKDPGCAHLPAPMADVAAGAAAGGCRLHQQQAGPPTTAAGHRQTGPKQHQQRPAGVKLSGAVRLQPGYSGGLVTVQGMTGQRRPDPDGFGTQLAVQVTGEAWVGKLPARVWVWVPGPGTSCQDCAVLDPVRLGEKVSQWVVMVRDADAKLIDAWPVYDRKVQIPQDRQLPIADDVDGGNPEVVDVKALKARAGRR